MSDIIDVIGFGALNLDKIIMVDKIPKSDEEGFIKSIDMFSGGSAANTIVGLARLGLNTGYIGKVGDDGEGSTLIESMLYQGVDIAGIKVSNGRSGLCLAFVDTNGDRALLIDPGVNDNITLDDINIDYVRKTKFLHLSGFICKESKQSFETQKVLMREINKTKISFDPGQIYAEMGLKKLRDIIKNTDIILSNKNEIKMLTGLDYKDGAQLLLNKGVEIVVVKLGVDGCYATNSEREFKIPIYNVNVIDTTGAGDAFNAGFLYGLIKDKNIEECGKLGNKVASFCIQKIGCRDGLPTLKDLVNLKG